jgi:hypothetical protein
VTPVSYVLGTAEARPADLAVSQRVGRLSRLALRLVDLQDLGAREYGLGFARGPVLCESGLLLMRGSRHC